MATFADTAPEEVIALNQAEMSPVYSDWDPQRRRRCAHVRYEYLPQDHVTSREGGCKVRRSLRSSCLGFSFAGSRMVSRHRGSGILLWDLEEAVTALFLW